ncbi:ABC transporter permease [Rhodanobacter sp. KK11]|jgi:putative ABC transport system permease protein|uniref:ABC transporter permease n=1 Tax=Rhodanobacter sp. KK11 TaxID=3083255 RepID=UPI0029673C0D|nr:ABC transporter permease [Rhodanobacter sp. KK11]MDW2980491.1 ABC transporter permease [Rhodanobacter sp. KK11]
MFGYYLDLALRSLGRHKVLTALMVLAIALGIGTSMTTLTVMHVLSGDPIPQKSAQLFRVRMNVIADDSFRPGDKVPDNLTRRDAEALLRDARADRQAAMSAGATVVVSAQGEPLRVATRYTGADFFSMFDVPMRYGQAWRREDDAGRARVAVISGVLNEQLFGGVDSVGKTLQVGDQSLRIVGVLGDWSMNPRFYDLSNGQFGDSEQMFVPLSTALDLKLSTSGSTSCWGSAPDSRAADAPCIWLQYWAELDTPAKAAAYRQYLQNYVALQQQAGRFTHAGQLELLDVMQWLDAKGVVPSDVRLQTWLALGFLGICLLNTVGLLLAKFLRRSGEIGVRRALGASRRAIFLQCLVEAGVVGLAGGVLGLALAALGLVLVRHQPTDYAAYIHMDLRMLLATFVLALTSSLLAGLLPAWRAMHVAPAVALKSN